MDEVIRNKDSELKKSRDCLCSFESCSSLNQNGVILYIERMFSILGLLLDRNLLEESDLGKMYSDTLSNYGNSDEQGTVSSSLVSQLSSETNQNITRKYETKVYEQGSVSSSSGISELSSETYRKIIRKSSESKPDEQSIVNNPSRILEISESHHNIVSKLNTKTDEQVSASSFSGILELSSEPNHKFNKSEIYPETRDNISSSGVSWLSSETLKTSELIDFVQNLIESKFSYWKILASRKRSKLDKLKNCTSLDESFSINCSETGGLLSEKSQNCDGSDYILENIYPFTNIEGLLKLISKYASILALRKLYPLMNQESQLVNKIIILTRENLSIKADVSRPVNRPERLSESILTRENLSTVSTEADVSRPVNHTERFFESILTRENLSTEADISGLVNRAEISESILTRENLSTEADVSRPVNHTERLSESILTRENLSTEEVSGIFNRPEISESILTRENLSTEADVLGPVNHPERLSESILSRENLSTEGDVSGLVNRPERLSESILIRENLSTEADVLGPVNHPERLSESILTRENLSTEANFLRLAERPERISVSIHNKVSKASENIVVKFKQDIDKKKESLEKRLSELIREIYVLEIEKDLLKRYDQDKSGIGCTTF